MHTCIVCPRSTKGLTRLITRQIKGMSLRPGRRRKRLQREAEEAAAKSGERQEEGEVGDEEESEWVSEPEPGVFITLVPLPEVGNRVKKIRFSKERFDDWGAQKWWSENYDKVMELYCIVSQQSSPTLAPSDDESQLVHNQEEEEEQEEEASRSSKSTTGSSKASPEPQAHSEMSMESKLVHNQEEEEEEEEEGNEAASRSSKSTAGSSKATPEPQPHCEMPVEIGNRVLEWNVEDETGVFFTVRSMPDGSREILRIVFSGDRFGEMKTRVWWEKNKARLQQQYSLNL
ncbi:protein Brevis radix-like 2 [Zingiber officinale]|uniref:protein Brevis radix-like 2 n=1 Tax=Zingiber officinale TaxID=94328 RepID=UPI001C4AEC05|nr:protein Brevis radix-like 2 [Zingiber officinale]